MHVFVYGSLMYLPVWQQVVQGQYAQQPAMAHGFARYAVPGEQYPAMVVQAAGQVRGLVWLNVDHGDIQRLDAFEGEEYERRTIWVNMSGSDQSLQADTYIWLKPERLRGDEWDVKAFEQQGLQQFLNKHVQQWTDTGRRQ
ncbi:MAG TPA: gamma-glutamylcyclotransferase family protein [Limnobacter sp.]|uniref:gamma-glutamylcyclotransferase family protein n=1 Tax=Limnobacter sp. TaxID=2003368 RepID=UPI002EDAF82D